MPADDLRLPMVAKENRLNRVGQGAVDAGLKRGLSLKASRLVRDLGVPSFARTIGGRGRSPSFSRRDPARHCRRGRRIDTATGTKGTDHDARGFRSIATDHRNKTRGSSPGRVRRPWAASGFQRRFKIYKPQMDDKIQRQIVHPVLYGYGTNHPRRSGLSPIHSRNVVLGTEAIDACRETVAPRDPREVPTRIDTIARRRLGVGR